MNWNEISNRYKNVGKNLIGKTNEGTSGLKDGLGKGSQDLSDIRRTHKVLLRIGFEFLVKSLYLKKGWNIYKFKIRPKDRQIQQFVNLNELELDLGKTMKFEKLIDNIHSVVPSYQDLLNLKSNLHKIREEGNRAIHSDKVDSIELSHVTRLRDNITNLMV